MSNPSQPLTADDSRHGTTRGYAAGCHEECCRTAKARRERYRRHYAAQGVHASLPALGTRRRLRALLAIGWTAQLLADRLGYVSEQGAQNLIHQETRATVHRRTHLAVAALYEELSMTPGPSHLNRLRAHGKGWEPPLSWDEGDLDNPDAVPHGADRDDPDREYPPELDAAVVTALLAGRRVKANRLERLEVLRASGLSVRELDTQYGWNLHRDQRLEARRDAA